MGALHAGHLSLIRHAMTENTDVIVSIYVNPTQFGVNEDLGSYPRTWDKDLAALHSLNDDFSSPEEHSHIQNYGHGLIIGRIVGVFAPSTKAMYPTLPPSSEPLAPGSFVTINPLGSVVEGAARPTFFRGVATVCMKLFNIVSPHRAYFGQKDIQQTLIIKRMVQDFHMDLEVVVVPTARELDGLAMSSRNVYLGNRRRAAAIILIEMLKTVERSRDSRGTVSVLLLLTAAADIAETFAQGEVRKMPKDRVRLVVDYLSIADRETMEALKVIEPHRGAILSGAIKLLPIEDPQPGEDCGLGDGSTPVRLIDNIILTPRT
ncbi:MAG: pantothenate synthase [Caeruleum heppii]|nr:MAG: pantothenate synthase [Caeruleum heppii]